ncbi:MAG: PPC domain-containing protein [Desulfobacterales bacterium]|nr:PPC domain-containing protein [Desulfobacterales bacterium]
MSFQPIYSGHTVTDSLSFENSLGYRIQVAANQKLVIRLDGPDDADFDLYVKYGEAVSQWDYDFKRITQYADEELTIGPTQAGSYFILVYAYRGEGKFSLSVDTAYEEVVLLPGQQVAGEIENSKGACYFRIPVDAGRRLIFDLNGPLEADFDLYLRFGQRPTNVNYDQRSYSGSSKEKIEVDATQKGDYFVMVHSYRGTGSFTLGAGSGRTSTLLIISSKGKLEDKYGSALFLRIDEQINAYAQSVRTMGHEALIIYVDEADGLAPYELDPVDTGDASSIKDLLDELDRKLHADHFFIVGGHDIIPFHVIPNPCGDDGDTVVYSDNPYASRDLDLLIPERALTRMPDDASTDGNFFIHLLEQVVQRTQVQSNQTFGLSAKVWKGASTRVYQEINPTGTVRLSPPITNGEIESDWIDDKAYYYFNLHGSEETENWYGQEGTRYPVAFSPQNLNNVSVENAVVCCEACYGANIIHKKADEALSLTFLEKKAACFVGSTKIAYGPSEPPCTEADLIVIKFFERVKEGLPFGVAFLRAKEDFARESIRMKGYLDKTEEKTLLEFVIFSDPLSKMEVRS